MIKVFLLIKYILKGSVVITPLTNTLRIGFLTLFRFSRLTEYFVFLSHVHAIELSNE